MFEAFVSLLPVFVEPPEKSVGRDRRAG